MGRLGLPDLLTLQALRRAERGVLTWCAGRFFDAGHVVGLLRSDVLGALVEDGLVGRSVPDGEGTARVVVSEVGRARRVELGRRQRGVAVPPAQHPAPESPAGHQGAAPPAGDRQGPSEGRSGPWRGWAVGR